MVALRDGNSTNIPGALKTRMKTMKAQYVQEKKRLGKTGAGATADNDGVADKARRYFQKHPLLYDALDGLFKDGVCFGLFKSVLCNAPRVKIHFKSPSRRCVVCDPRRVPNGLIYYGGRRRRRRDGRDGHD